MIGINSGLIDGYTLQDFSAKVCEFVSNGVTNVFLRQHFIAILIFV